MLLDGQADALTPDAAGHGLATVETRVVDGRGALTLFERVARRQDRDQGARPT
ncbi:hypothetical protein [Nocardioides iriomotensis]|uniref:hypothetical protein n=1 Tax=Nocardioides iriomotensis TaxID=715784 RepID=UPI0013EC3993|nr:hypothetical protein [Nocardioides iriomotensis]